MSQIAQEKIFNAQAILAGKSALSSIIDLSRLSPQGFFALQIALTGVGTLKLEWVVSADRKNFLAPTDYETVITPSFTITSGNHSLEYGDSAYISGVAGMVEINNLTAAVTAVTASTVTVAIDSQTFTAYSSGGTIRPVGKDTDADAVITAISQAAAAVITVNKGREYFEFAVPVAPYLKIKASEIGSSNPISLSAWLVTA